MTQIMVDPERLHFVAPGSHVSWVVDDAELDAVRTRILDAGRRGREKLFAFGSEAAFPLPVDDDVVVMDPYVAALDRGSLDPEKMFAAFRENDRIAREEGFDRIRVVADMDWMLPLGPTSDMVVGFEVLLDRVVQGLGATVVCAYRSASFDEDTLDAVACVHPVIAGHVKPLFRLVADGERWIVDGEVDFAVAPAFAAALNSVVSESPAIVDISRLEFIDAAGLRALARALELSGGRARLHGATPAFRRLWDAAGYHPFPAASERRDA